jgi:hypothetical protein
MTSEKSKVMALDNLSATLANESSEDQGFLKRVARKDKKSETVGVKNYVTLVRCNFGHEYDTASGV